MAKKRLFGNKPEPCCETCSYGKLSADASVVLCRRGGVMSLFYSCRHFHYDPLKRTPRRQKPLDAFDAAAFSLSGLSDETPPAETTAETSGDNELLTRLHDYLNANDTPDAQAILDLLNVAPVQKDDPAPEEDLVLEEKIDPEEEFEAEETILIEETVLIDDKKDSDSFVEPTSSIIIGNAQRATPETIPSPTIADNTPDIFEDLKRLQVGVASSAARAALQDFSLKFGHDLDRDDDELDPFNSANTDVLTLIGDDDEEDDEILDADDLIFKSPLASDETVETLEINADGSVTAKKADG